MSDEEQFRPMRQDAEGRLEAQSECGHWGRIAVEWEAAHLSEGFCPACQVKVFPHQGAAGTHLRCYCCERCYIYASDGVGYLIHSPDLRVR